MTPQHNGFKQTEVGTIPSDWDVSTVGQSFEVRNNMRLPISRSVRSEMTGPYPYYGPTAIQDHINEYRYEGEHALIGEDGDHFLKWRDQSMTQLVAGKFNVNNHAHVVKGVKNHTSWFFWYFSHRDISNYLTRQGAGRFKLRKSTLLEIPCAVPPPDEQRAIAEALSDVDALLGVLDRMLTKKRDLKQATMQQLLTGQTRLPGFKGEWVTKPLPEVCQFRGGKAHEQFIDEAGGYVCVNSKFISTGGEVRKYATKNLCPARKNDILMVMSDLPNGRALAKAFLADRDDFYAVNQRVCALTAYKDCPAFVYYMLDRNPYFLRFDNGVSQTHLLNDVFQKCPVRLAPTVDEQTAIAEVLSDMDAEIAALERRREKTQDLKQGMMQELLTGRTRLV